MTQEEVERRLQEIGYTDWELKEIEHGVQFKVAGCTVNCYGTGRTLVQGQKTEDYYRLKKVFEPDRSTGDSSSLRQTKRTLPTVGKTSAKGTSKEVFVVYGHDRNSRDGLELLLRKMGLNPIILSDSPGAGKTVIEKLESHISNNDQLTYGCVLLTPDDEGYPQGQSQNVQYRARQNVILEMGMLMARLGRGRVAILHKQSVELPSDISGLLYLPYHERVDEVEQKLYRELREAGMDPDHP